MWVNGHEWAKRQAAKAGIGFAELANGFAGCEDPEGLQAVCDQLGPAHIEMFFERWMRAVPTPLDEVDRAAGYWWELSMRQVETSRTIVFDAPRRARAFFEATVADNIDLGRPDEIKVIFDRRIRKDTTGEFATKVVTRGTDVTINAFYKHSRIKEYLKEGRALRIEDDLRPATTPPERPHRPGPPHQHLYPHPRRDTSVDLLHQTRPLRLAVGAAEHAAHQGTKALVGEADAGNHGNAEGAGQGHDAWITEAQGSGSLALLKRGL